MRMELYPYQEEGVRFLCQTPHAFLADDMGLGKTIQVIGAVNRNQLKKGIVICPASVKITWVRQLRRWLEDKRIGIYMVRDGKDSIPAHADIVVINYELAVKDRLHNQLVKRGEKSPYDFVVFDEARYLKSMDAKRTRRFLGKSSVLHHAKSKWCLDGTPVPNRPIELYPILRALAPQTIEPYTDYDDFGRYFCGGFFSGMKWNHRGASNIQELQERIKPFMLRRSKEDVLPQLPAKVETYVELSDVQCLYTEDFYPIATVRRELALAKLAQATEYIRRMVDEVGKVVVFAHHRDVIEQLSEGLSEYGAVICYGGMTAEQKQKSIDLFSNASRESGQCQVFIAQTVAGGTGIDGLQTSCNYVVFVELDWSPGVMDQAIDRLRRIGQQHTVFVHYLIAPGTLDERVDDTLDQKRKVIEQLIIGELPTMTVESCLERIAVALGKIASNPVATQNAPVTETMSQPVAAPKTEPTKPKSPGRPRKANIEVVEPADEVPPVDPKAQFEALYREVNKFLATPETDRDKNKRIFREILWPKYNTTELKTLAPEHYAAVLDELKAGPEAFYDRLDNGETEDE